MKDVKNSSSQAERRLKSRTANISPLFEFKPQAGDTKCPHLSKSIKILIQANL